MPSNDYVMPPDIREVHFVVSRLATTQVQNAAEVTIHQIRRLLIQYADQPAHKIMLLACLATAYIWTDQRERALSVLNEAHQLGKETPRPHRLDVVIRLLMDYWIINGDGQKVAAYLRELEEWQDNSTP